MGTRWNDGFGSRFFDGLDKGIAVKAFVSNHRLGRFAFQQRLGLRDIIVLPAGDGKIRGIAERVYRRMDFGGEAATASAKALGILPPFLCRAPAAC